LFFERLICFYVSFTVIVVLTPQKGGQLFVFGDAIENVVVSDIHKKEGPSISEALSKFVCFLNFKFMIGHSRS